MALIQPASIGSATAKRKVGQRYQSVIVMLMITCLLFGGIGSRLAHLQLTEGAHNRHTTATCRYVFRPCQLWIPGHAPLFKR